MNFQKINTIQTAQGTLVWGMVMMLVMGLLGCSQPTRTDTSGPVVSVERMSGCGGWTDVGPIEDDVRITSCVYWDFDGSGTLTLMHYNTYMNCCTDLDFTYTVADDEINIRATEDGAYCRCICSFDIEYVITGLEEQTYTIRFLEKYLSVGQDSLIATVDLATTPIGNHCVDRPE